MNTVTAAIVVAAGISSSIFTDGYFGYRSEEFHREWHRAWNAPGAHVVQWSPVEHGKTQQATGWGLHCIGSDPQNTRVLWIGAKQESGKKSTNIIKRAIEHPSPFLANVFPGLRPGEPWTETTFRVKGARATEKDNTLEVAGVGTQILGGRFTHIVLDDVCNYETTYSATRRREMTRWVTSTVLGRLLPGGRIIVLGNAWYPDDVMHELQARGFRTVRNEAFREDGAGGIVPGSILWPAQFPLDRLGKLPTSFQADGSPSKRRELGTIEAMRQLRCIPYSSGQGRFQVEWFERAMSEGAGLTLVDTYDGHAGHAFGGCDIGISEKEGADPSAFWVFAQQSDGRRRLLNAMEERLAPPRLVDTFADWYSRFGGVWRVENNAAQEFMRAWVKTKGIPTQPHTTGKNKADPTLGIPSLAVELEQGMWVLPSGDERSCEVAIRWRSECLDWGPGQHTGDMLMASWFAREASRGAYSDVSVAVQGAQTQAPTGGMRANYGARRRLFGRG